MDQRIKTPGKIALLTGIDFLGAFCSNENNKFLNTESIQHKSFLYIFEKIRTRSVIGHKPFIIQILSVWEGAGKKAIAEILHSEMEKRGLSVKTINVHLQTSDKDTVTNIQSDIISIYSANHYTDLLTVEEKQKNYILSVIPAIGLGIDNPVLLQDADISLLIYDASLTWSKADYFNIQKLKQLIPNHLYTVLSNASPDNLEEVYGEIQKKRSKLRILIKKVLKRIS